MSDGITDSARDEERAKVSQNIFSLEMKLLDDQATREDIEELVYLWKKYRSIGVGYWGSSNVQMATRRIKKYEWFLRNGMLNIVFKEEN